jgi:hypothetical protein
MLNDTNSNNFLKVPPSVDFPPIVMLGTRHRIGQGRTKPAHTSQTPINAPCVQTSEKGRIGVSYPHAGRGRFLQRVRAPRWTG